MRTALETVNITDQAVTVGGLIDLGTNVLVSGCSVIHTEDSASVSLTKKGLYLILFDADFDITTTGPVTVQMLFKGVPVVGANDTVQATAASPVGIHIAKLLEIRPSCCAIDNRGAFQFQVSAAGTFINVKAIVVEL